MDGNIDTTMQQQQQQQQVHVSTITTPAVTAATTACRRRPARYAISSAGSDGVGHQMEAKLSCLVTAAALDMTYIHQPLHDLEHGTDPHAMEALFGLSRLVLSSTGTSSNAGDGGDDDHLLPKMRMYNETTMQRVCRKPLPWVGRCDEASWFDDKLEVGTTTLEEPDDCHKDNSTTINAPPLSVCTHDNCWDFLWCHVDEAAHAWDRIRSTVRQHFLHPFLFHQQQQQQQSDDNNNNNNNNNNNMLTVALHVRQGDAGARSMNLLWCKRVLQQIAQAVRTHDGQQHTRSSTVHVMIHSDASQSFIQENIQMEENDKQAAAPIQISIYGRDHPDATIERAVYDMVTSDILVASDSSLSHTAALLRHRHQPVVHPKSNDRSRMGLLGWKMLDKHLQLCSAPPPAAEGRECAAWTATNESFWASMVATAIQSRQQYIL